MSYIHNPLVDLQTYIQLSFHDGQIPDCVATFLAEYIFSLSVALREGVKSQIYTEVFHQR